MGKKSILSVIVGSAGGIIFGYALGFHHSTIIFSEEISSIIYSFGISLRPVNPQFSNLMEYLGEGVSQKFREYIYQNVFNPLPFYIIGIIIIIAGFFIAYKTGETSWLPWNRGRDGE